MLLTPTGLVKSIKMDLGIYGMSVPVDDLDESIMDVIRTKTLVTFSEFLPHEFQTLLDLSELEELPTNNRYALSRFVLPDIFGDRQIVGLRDVSIDLISYGIGSHTYDSSLGFGINDVSTMMLKTATSNLYSAMSPARTFNFVSPNIMELYNFDRLTTRIRVIFHLQHADNFSTIPASRTNSFYELAVIDTKIFLYQLMKHYRNMQTPVGNIDIQIDDWADAMSERKDWMQNLKSSHHLEGQPLYIV